MSFVGRLGLPRWVPILAAVLVLADRAWGSPTPWPLPTTPSPDFSVYADLDGKKGAVFVMPTRFPDQLPPRARWRDPALLAQLHHKHPISEAASMGHTRSSTGQHAGDLLKKMAQTGKIDRGHRDAFRGPGFVWLAAYKRHMRENMQRDRFWSMCFGAPVASNNDVDLYKLDGGVNEQCLRGVVPSGGPRVPGAR